MSDWCILTLILPQPVSVKKTWCSQEPNMNVQGPAKEIQLYLRAMVQGEQFCNILVETEQRKLSINSSQIQRSKEGKYFYGLRCFLRTHLALELIGAGVTVTRSLSHTEEVTDYSRAQDSPRTFLMCACMCACGHTQTHTHTLGEEAWPSDDIGL